MGSINDYLRNRSNETTPRSGRFRNRLLGQIAISLALFLLIAASVNADNIFGDSARYVVGSGISAENSWIDFAAAENERDAEEADPPAGSISADQNIFPADDSAAPDFTAPASGIVITDVAVTAGGFASKEGILIQGNAGQTVKAAAGGKVDSVEAVDGGYIIGLSHSGGFTSVYQGLSEVNVGSGSEVNMGAALGSSASGEVTFSLLLNGKEVNPLDYLFE